MRHKPHDPICRGLEFDALAAVPAKGIDEVVDPIVGKGGVDEALGRPVLSGAASAVGDLEASRLQAGDDLLNELLCVGHVAKDALLCRGFRWFVTDGAKFDADRKLVVLGPDEGQEGGTPSMDDAKGVVMGLVNRSSRTRNGVGSSQEEGKFKEFAKFLVEPLSQRWRKGIARKRDIERAGVVCERPSVVEKRRGKTGGTLVVEEPGESKELLEAMGGTSPGKGEGDGSGVLFPVVVDHLEFGLQHGLKDDDGGMIITQRGDGGGFKGWGTDIDDGEHVFTVAIGDEPGQLRSVTKEIEGVVQCRSPGLGMVAACIANHGGRIAKHCGVRDTGAQEITLAVEFPGEVDSRLKFLSAAGVPFSPDHEISDVGVCVNNTYIVRTADPKSKKLFFGNAIDKGESFEEMAGEGGPGTGRGPGLGKAVVAGRGLKWRESNVGCHVQKRNPITSPRLSWPIWPST